MIHARKDYDRIQDPENKIPLDEPVFLIRGQDLVGAETVETWLKLTCEQEMMKNKEIDNNLSRAVRIHIQKMRHWAQHAGHGPTDVPSEELKFF